MSGMYLLSSNNLSDVANTIASRGHLGLGGAAVLNVGTVSGTVADGGDMVARDASILSNAESAATVMLANSTVARQASLATFNAVVNARAYGASGSAQATTGTMAPNSTTLQLANALDFQNGQGIRVDDAGTGGDGTRLIATIVSGAGTKTLILSIPASAAVSSVNVTHDDTVAIQTAISAVAAQGGGEIVFDNGTYQIGGSPPNPNVANAVLEMPLVNIGHDITIRMRGVVAQGFFREVINGTITNTGTVFLFPYACPNQSTNGSVQQGIGIQIITTGPLCTAVNWIMSDILFRVPPDTGYIWINGHSVQNTYFERVGVYTGNLTNSAVPTNPLETGIALGGTNCGSVARQCYVQGLYNGISPCVHAILDGCYIQSCYIGISVFAGDHLQYWSHVLMQACIYLIGRNVNDPVATPLCNVIGIIDTELVMTGSWAFEGMIKNPGLATGQLGLSGSIYYRYEAPAGGAPYNTGLNIWLAAQGTVRWIQLGGGGEQVQSKNIGPSPYTVGAYHPAQTIIEGTGLTGVTFARNGVSIQIPINTSVTGVPNVSVFMTDRDTLSVTWSGTPPIMYAIPM